MWGVSNELSKGQRLLGQVETELSLASGWELGILVGRVRSWLSQQVGRFEECPQQCSAIKVWSRGGRHSGDHGAYVVWKKSECTGQLRGGSPEESGLVYLHPPGSSRHKEILDPGVLSSFTAESPGMGDSD